MFTPLLKFSDDFQTFSEINGEYIEDLAREELYVEGGYLDDYDMGNIEVDQWKFESVAETLFTGILDYPVHYLDRMVNRPEHFYLLTFEDVENATKKSACNI